MQVWYGYVFNSWSHTLFAAIENLLCASLLHESGRIYAFLLKVTITLCADTHLDYKYINGKGHILLLPLYTMLKDQLQPILLKWIKKSIKVIHPTILYVIKYLWFCLPSKIMSYLTTFIFLLPASHLALSQCLLKSIIHTYFLHIESIRKGNMIYKNSIATLKA